MRLFAGLPGMTMRDDEAFWFISHLPAPGKNVLKAYWPEAQAEDRIDELFAQIGEHLETIDWFVFPGDQPGDLNQRLEARGMPGGPGGHWLYADLAALKNAPVVSPDFHIEQVRDDRMMAKWVRLSEAGFGEGLSCFYDAYARHGYGPEAFSLHYIGYLNQIPVTSGTLLEAGGTASVYDLSTPPEFRGHGFGGALTHFLMSEIQKRGYAETWIWSSAMAKSLYQSLGYVDADFGIREHTWRKGNL